MFKVYKRIKLIEMRLRKLIELLGVTDYGDTLQFFDLMDSDAGTLQRISLDKDRQIALLRDDLELLKEHLDVKIIETKAERKVVSRKKSN